MFRYSTFRNGNSRRPFDFLCWCSDGINGIRVYVGAEYYVSVGGEYEWRNDVVSDIWSYYEELCSTAYGNDDVSYDGYVYEL
jgi:hypothetical protein